MVYWTSKTQAIGLILLALWGVSCTTGGALKAATPAVPLAVDPAPMIRTESEALPEPTPDIQKNDLDKLRKEWCQAVAEEFKLQGWKPIPCLAESLQLGGYSAKGKPLFFYEFGAKDEKTNKPVESDNVTLILSAVHGDEINPVYIGIRLLYWLSQNQTSFPGARVVVAPIVNPDGTFSRPKTRTNARGVDVNRNFETADWKQDAHKKWQKDQRNNPRRFPGKEPNSEPETLFQIQLIERVKPNKILSIHAPLNVLDYDGPNSMVRLTHFSREYVQKCLELRHEVKARSTGFFPGSLGNYSGQERGIPTFTLELPTANPRKAEAYWWQFKSGIKTVIQFKVPENLKSGPSKVESP